MGYQLGHLDSLKLPVPSCRDASVPFGPDSVGPLRVGEKLADVRKSCPQMLRMWDMGDEAIPAPTGLVRFGSVIVRVNFTGESDADTAYAILTTDSSARTPEGVGIGTSLATLRTKYGLPKVEEAECAVYEWFASRPKLSFRLDVTDSFDCGYFEQQKPPRYPRAGRVAEMFIHQ